MKSSALPKIIIASAVLITFVLAAQLYWLQKTYYLEEKEFNVKVHSALNSVVEQIRISQQDTTPFIEAIEQPSLDYYIANIKYRINADSIENMLKLAFEYNDLYTSYRFGIYNAATGKFENIEYESFYPTEKKSSASQSFPINKRPFNYLAVLFVNRTRYIIHEMNFWIFSTAALTLMIIAFAISIAILLRQRLLSKIQKDFINNMTHEFRTPISTIQLSTEVLKNAAGIQAQPRLFNYANIIESEAAHLEQQVERVLQVANMEHHTLHLNQENINVHEIFQQSVQDFSQIIAQKNGRFDLQLQAQKFIIIADKLHFINIIFNLLDNAIKYSAEPIIVITTRNENSNLVIQIKDNGIGIARQYHKLLFTKFFRVPTGNIHEVKGFGLGLNYVKLYTRAFRGKVSVESEPGKGSIFTLYFPTNIN